MLTITQSGTSPKSQTERRAEITRVQEELEALDHMADALGDAHTALGELTKLASTNPVKFRSAFAVGLDTLDAITRQWANVRSEIAKLDVYLTEITRTQAGAR